MFDQKPEIRSFIASIDLSGQLFHVVDLHTAEHYVTNPTANNGYGVLQNHPKAGEFASVAIRGVTLVRVGAAVTIGSHAICADSGGWVITTVVTSVANALILGRFLTAAASGMVAALDLDPFRYST